jgi:hypothetical protein
MSAKSLNFAAELRDVLAKRFATVSAVAFDTDGEPYFTIGAGTAGSQSALVKVKTFLPLGVDSLGLAARGYTPVVTQLVLETSSVANVALLTEANELALVGELGHRGSRLEMYLSANGTAPALSGITSGNLKATFDPDLKYRLMDQQ